MLYPVTPLDATFGRGEADVAVALTIDGRDDAFANALPDKGIGEAAIRRLNCSP